jgi:hypothetical protein
MSGSHIPNGLMVVFSITTLVVFLYPIVKLTPSWLERKMAKKIILHREAIAVLAQTVETTTDIEQRARLQTQLDYHQATINALVPGEVAAARTAPVRFDTAA